MIRSGRLNESTNNDKDISKLKKMYARQLEIQDFIVKNGFEAAMKYKDEWHKLLGDIGKLAQKIDGPGAIYGKGILYQIDKEMNESAGMNESTYDGDTVNWNKISTGDVVGWTIEGMGRPPKVGDDFRVGPFTGKCTKITGSKVFMKVEGDARQPINESIYYVSGSTPTGVGDSSISTARGKIDTPAKAIEQWFKIGAKHRTGTAITAIKKSDAIALVNWANDNQDKITEWYNKYGCPYKLEYLLKGISDQVKRKCSSFYENEYGDMVYPFDVG